VGRTSTRSAIVSVAGKRRRDSERATDRVPCGERRDKNSDGPGHFQHAEPRQADRA
jgi:hypothetical protein